MRIFLSYALPSLIGFVAVNYAVGDSNNGEALPLVEIVKRLETNGYEPFSEISKDDGNWEIEVRQNDVAYELTVDAVSGQVLSQHRDDPDDQPPTGGMSLSQVLKSLADKDGYGDVDEVSFERRYWEIEVTKSSQKRELHVDPMTAKIIADRIDD